MSNYLKKLAYVHEAMKKLAMEKEAFGERLRARRQARIANGGWYPGKFMGRPAPVSSNYRQPSASAPVRLPAQAQSEPTVDINRPITAAVPPGPTASQIENAERMRNKLKQYPTSNGNTPKKYPMETLRYQQVSNPASVVNPVIDLENYMSDIDITEFNPDEYGINTPVRPRVTTQRPSLSSSHKVSFNVPTLTEDNQRLVDRQQHANANGLYMNPETGDFYVEKPVNVNAPGYRDYLDSGDPSSNI